MSAVCEVTELPVDQCAHCAGLEPSDGGYLGDPGVCRSCGADILWVTTVNGRKMPLDVYPSDDGNVTVRDGVGSVLGPLEAEAADDDLFLSHFVTCEQAGSWRRR